MKIGLILEGGALRGLFTAGAMDYIMEQGMEFDYISGVSAGAGNMMNFLSNQKGRTRTIISPGKKYAYYGLRQLIKTDSFLNLDRMVVEFAKETFPYDFEAYQAATVEHEVVVVNCDTAEAEYLSRESCWGENTDLMLEAVKASCSVPLISLPVTIGEHDYMDGSLVDSIPFERALERGCDKVVVIMTKNGDETPTDYNKYKWMINAAYRKNYPKFADALLQRADVYAVQRARMEELEREGKVFVLRPSVPCISKFEKSEEKRAEYYFHGYERMKECYSELLKFMERDA